MVKGQRESEKQKGEGERKMANIKTIRPLLVWG